jgi:prophage antirepressor-like protein
MNDMIVKQFEGREIRTMIVDGKPVWVAIDIAETLGYPNPRSAIQDFLRTGRAQGGIDYKIVTTDEARVWNFHTRSNRGITVLFESGLFAFLNYSNKPPAIPFQHFVNREILPSIRKIGAYISDHADPQMLREAAEKLESARKIEIAMKAIEQAMPSINALNLSQEAKASFINSVYKSCDCDVIIPVVIKESLAGAEMLAVRFGILSSAGKPHSSAMGSFLRHLGINGTETLLTVNGGAKQVPQTQYPVHESSRAIKQWIDTNGKPNVLPGKDKHGNSTQFSVTWK